MRSSKIFKLLEAFSQRELEDFHAFLHTRLYNAQDDLCKLYQAVCEMLRAKQTGEDHEEKVFATIFPDQAYDAKKAHNLKHELVKQARSFLAHQKLHQDTTQQRLYLLADTRERQDAPAFQAEWKKNEDHLRSKLANLDSGDLLYRFKMGIEQVQVRASARDRDSFLPEVLERLDDFYKLQRLQLVCALLNHQAIHNVRKGTPPLKFDDWDDYEYPLPRSVMGMYIAVLRMLSEPEKQSHYDTLCDMLFEANDPLELATFSELFTHLMNRCTRNLNSGLDGAKQQYLELFERAKGSPLAMDALLKSPWHRKNLVQVAASEGNFVTALEIAQASSNPAPQNDTIQTYSHGVIHFYKCELPQALRLFAKVAQDKRDRFCQFDARVFMMLIHYVSEDDAMYALNDAFRMAVDRDPNLAAQHKKKFKSFQKFFARLVNCAFSDAKGLAAFRSKCANASTQQRHLWVFDWLDQVRRKKLG
jgi:hypothetical protein